MFVHSDGIPVVGKSESESISSGESIEDSTPPDTPSNTDLLNVSGNSNSSINKKIKGRGEPKMSSSRHKVSAQHQPQQIVYTMQQIPAAAALSSEHVLAPNVTQPQPQTQQTIAQPQQTPQTIQSINSAPATIQAIGIANPQVIYQTYAQATHQMQKSQMNQTYPYQPPHLAISNRASILSPNTTTAAPPPATANYRMPAYHMQPNGDMIFPTTIAYMPQTAISLTRPPYTTVVAAAAQPMQHLPTITSLTSKSNQNTMVSSFLLANENAKPTTSCFNCGSNQHTGQECQEASMEDVTRGIYKLDYNSTAVNDTSKDVSDLDNGGSGVNASDPIAHMSPSVLNK